MEITEESETIRLLLLEDNRLDAELIVRELCDHGFNLDWKRTQTKAGFLAALEEPTDLIVADYSMPSFDGMQALELVKSRELDIPYLLVSGVLGDEYVVTAIKGGADDFILKDRLSRLGPAAIRALRNKELRDQYRLVDKDNKAAEERFFLLAEMQEQILDSLPANVALLNAEGNIVMVNEAWKKFGAANGLQAPNHGIGQNYIDVCRSASETHCLGAADAADSITRVLQGQATDYEAIYPCHAPTEKRWFRLMVSRLSKAENNGAVVMHVNITEQKRAEEVVLRSERQQRQLVQQLEAERRRLVEAQAVAKVGSWETDAKVLEVIWSEETYRIFEISPADFQPTHAGFLEFVHPDDRQLVDAKFRASLSTEGTYSLEHRLLLNGGTIKFVEERWQVICGKDNLPIRAVGTCRDVTENRVLQQQLLQSQKMEAIGKLAGGVAHDFNNLLTVILGYTDTMIRQASPADPIRSMLNDIEGCSRRAANLTRQLLTFSRQEVLNPQLLDLNATISDLEMMLRRLIGEDIKLQVELAPMTCQMRMDRGHLEQIIINLVVNARDAMPTGGELKIETAKVELDASDARQLAGDPGHYLSLSVTDSGIGIEEEIKPRIFEPFFTTKPPGKGTGLGLATVFGIIRQCNGLIRLESQVGVGTQFQILLPVANVRAEARTHSEPTAVSGSESILVVEDEAVVRRVTQFTLESQGYKVTLASNGQEAIDIVKSTAEPFQLIVTDVIMPGMSGRILVEHLLRVRPELKVLFVSGYTADAVLNHGVLESQHAFLQKPFTPAGLCAKVREALDA